MKRLILGVIVIMMIVGNALEAAAETALSYVGCYEVAAVRPHPRALIDPKLPPGFTAAPFLDPALGLGAYVVVGYQCQLGSSPVSEVLSLVLVNPPPELAGSSANYLLLQGTTSRPDSAALYQSWCLNSFERGDVTFNQTTTPAIRSAVITADHTMGDVSMTTAVPGPTLQTGPAGTLRILDVGRDGTGIVDLDFTAAVPSLPGAALVTIGGVPQPMVATHIFGSGDAANDWSLYGRCA